MSPPRSGSHSFRQTRIVFKLEQLMAAEGDGPAECPVQTDEGVRATGSAWMSKGRFAQLPDHGVHQIAPGICVEVRSPSKVFQETQEKLRLYLAKGAVECWVCDRNGWMTFFNADGPVRRAEPCPDFPEQMA